MRRSGSAAGADEAAGLELGQLFPRAAGGRDRDRDDRHSLLQASTDDERAATAAAPSLWARLQGCVAREPAVSARTIALDGEAAASGRYPANVTRNQKYSVLSFVPSVLYGQFRYFMNLYFLVVALTQFVPALQIGFLFTYVSPLVFVLLVTLCKEAVDDLKRHWRDREVNGARVERLTRSGIVEVGHVVVLRAEQRVPADVLLLRTSERAGAGTAFVRTDQLDGETDWKLRRALPWTQQQQPQPQPAAPEQPVTVQRGAAERDRALLDPQGLFDRRLSVYAEAPRKDIYAFAGKATRAGADGEAEAVEALSAEHVVWAGSVLAAGAALGLVLYTGRETRAALNSSAPRTKAGVLEDELNALTKVLCALMVALSAAMLLLHGLHGPWPLYFFRYIILFSSIIPISLRVNLDMAKAVYSAVMMADRSMPGMVARTSTIPEELGRVGHLLSDKTGTLTRNQMRFKRLHLGAAAYTNSPEALADLAALLQAAPPPPAAARDGRGRRAPGARALDAVLAIALTHNVTPVSSASPPASAPASAASVPEAPVPDYQASSPDEVALVQFAASVGLTLVARSQGALTLRGAHGLRHEYALHAVFPFSSATKRMGVVAEEPGGQVAFYVKGADEVLAPMVEASDWLDEECGNMAREGLRTLVYARRLLSPAQWHAFQAAQARYARAQERVEDREEAVRAAVATLEEGMELLAVTGVEDLLQDGVRPTLEALRHAGVRVWMITGDKLETAQCIAHSSGLVPPGLPLSALRCASKQDAYQQLNLVAAQPDAALVVDGASLHWLLRHYRTEFADAASKKAELVALVRGISTRRVAAIGDGGNDVAMIVAADVGVGIVGREGTQASLAADYSVLAFRDLQRLLLWHGRNSYKRSARLAQFVFHRGLIISWVQAVFSALYYFAPIALYTGWLMVGYTTLYTMAPVFSLVLDEDVSEELVFRYPELYRELQKGRALSYKTFFTWVLKSLYQGGVIMVLAIFLWENSLVNIVAISFSALVLCELLNVAFEIHRWHRLMLLAELCTVAAYAASLLVLRTYFDSAFILTLDFLWKVCLLTAVSSLPVYVSKVLSRRIDPSAGSKLVLASDEP